MTLDRGAALERVLSGGDEWQSWRALRLDDEDAGPMPPIPYQLPEGALVGGAGKPSPGATGCGLSHLAVLGLQSSAPASRAAAWLEAARTEARAWLEDADQVPGELTTPGAAEVWATAAATCGLLAAGRDPGPRAIDLLRGEADLEGRFTGGAYATFAAAAAYWLAEGPTTEMAEWGLRWARERAEEWGPPEWSTALIFWAAAGVPAEHPTVELFVDSLRESGEAEGYEDLGLTLLTLELFDHFDSAA